MKELQKKKFGNQKNPLLISIRSGARVSMPGMMDTILNLGLNDKTVLALVKKTSNAKFAKSIQYGGGYGQCGDEFDDVLNYIKKYTCVKKVVDNESIRTNFSNADLQNAKFIRDNDINFISCSIQYYKS